MYHVDDLRAAAVRKYGEEGFRKKEESRLKRENKKRRRQDDTERLHVFAGLQQPVPSTTSAAGAVNAAPILVGGVANHADVPTVQHRINDRASGTLAVTPLETALLRASLLKLARKAACVMEGNSHKVWSVDVPCVKPDMVAALINRPDDSVSKTPFKVNKALSVKLHACHLFGCDEADLLQVFYRDGVGVQILDDILLRYKPAKLMLSVQGEGQLVCDQRTMWI
jgi:hypothetical protein